jgi:hypothetical protein
MTAIHVEDDVWRRRRQLAGEKVSSGSSADTALMNICPKRMIEQDGQKGRD